MLTQLKVNSKIIGALKKQYHTNFFGLVMDSKHLNHIDLQSKHHLLTQKHIGMHSSLVMAHNNSYYVDLAMSFKKINVVKCLGCKRRARKVQGHNLSGGP